MNRFASVLALAAVLVAAGAAQAQYYSTYYHSTCYEPQAVYYEPAPVSAYYAPATYYGATSYYAPAPAYTAYYPATHTVAYPAAYYSYYPRRWGRWWW